MDLVLCLCQELKLESCESDFRRWLSCRSIYFMLESSKNSSFGKQPAGEAGCRHHTYPATVLLMSILTNEEWAGLDTTGACVLAACFGWGRSSASNVPRFVLWVRTLLDPVHHPIFMTTLWTLLKDRQCERVDQL